MNPYPKTIEDETSGVVAPNRDYTVFEEGKKAGRGEEQKRMTKALRKLYKQGWTLSNVIEAEDTMGG